MPGKESDQIVIGVIAGHTCSTVPFLTGKPIMYITKFLVVSVYKIFDNFKSFTMFLFNVLLR